MRYFVGGFVVGSFSGFRMAQFNMTDDHSINAMAAIFTLYVGARFGINNMMQFGLGFLLGTLLTQNLVSAETLANESVGSNNYPGMFTAESAAEPVSGIDDDITTDITPPQM